MLKTSGVNSSLLLRFFFTVTVNSSSTGKRSSFEKVKKTRGRNGNNKSLLQVKVTLLEPEYIILC